MTNDYEVLSIRNKKTIFTVLYRPPNGSFSAFLSYIDSLLSFAAENQYVLTIGGDLNIDVTKDTTASLDFLIVLQSNNFRNAIATPTRISSMTSSVLDLFITNAPSDKTMSGTICADISDHLPIFLMVERNKSLEAKKTNEKRLPRYIIIHSAKIP